MAVISDFSLENNDHNQGLPLVTDPLMRFVQEIDVIFQAQKNTFVSDQSIGKVNIEDLLYNRSVNERQIISNIDQEISLTEGVRDFIYTVSIRFVMADAKDVVIIDVTVSPGKKNEYKKSYIFK